MVFTEKQYSVSTFSAVRLMAKFAGMPLIEGLKLGWVVLNFLQSSTALHLGNGAK